MQHQLIDIFLYDGLQPSSAPIYQSGYGCMKDILVMREDSSCYCDLLYQEGGGNSSIPLFPMGEKWKLSHRAPPGLQRRMEKFLVNCMREVEEKKITSFDDFVADVDGHLVCSWDMRKYQTQLEKRIWERRIIFIKELPGNCIISLPSPDFTGVLADQKKDGIRKIGSFIMKSAIERFCYIGNGN